MTIMPGFDRHPNEVPLLGRLLVAFGEIEVEYFDNTLAGVISLENRWLRWAGKKPSYDAPMPKALDRPPAHNPPSQHVPQWISEEEKRIHLELAQEVENIGQQPQLPPSVLRLTREEWAAKDAKDAHLSGESPA